MRICLPLLIVALWFAGWYLEVTEPAAERPAPQVIYIPPGTPVKEVAHLLRARGLLRSEWGFYLEGLRLGLLSRLKAGEYELSPHQSPAEILRQLAEGRVITHIVTIPEGANVWEVADLLERAGLISRKEFLARALDSDLAHSLGIPGPTVEGFLFPDTYYFVKGLSAEEIIRIMVERFWEVWRKYEPRARELGVSVYEVVTLASIVEKEAVLSREKPLIAAVYWNRLRRGMPLQADPTVRYALRRFRGRLYYKHLRVDSPYNTYRYPGLPPTPIANPGEKSLRAVLYPAKVPYLYFVSRGDGSHKFSTTYREHLRAVRELRRKRQRSYQ
ncbi:endolytic transglycosylase MltG [Thermosulfurimonas marina]|uniref:Endolytic murein transglycosylase n=1 Tax=Thermosulfurimonas marina TaxID=2047767 RepID=A0A6H1WRC0_9BACT|nr:endolytic transglycosylase MltG [Thermosulfurimonas marina]QJA05767.1 endolytic transglycosylase MltG [Thermosulfurimonas marina]